MSDMPNTPDLPEGEALPLAHRTTELPPVEAATTPADSPLAGETPGDAIAPVEVEADDAVERPEAAPVDEAPAESGDESLDEEIAAETVVAAGSALAVGSSFALLDAADEPDAADASDDADVSDHADAPELPGVPELPDAPDVSDEFEPFAYDDAAAIAGALEDADASGLPDVSDEDAAPEDIALQGALAGAAPGDSGVFAELMQAAEEPALDQADIPDDSEFPAAPLVPPTDEPAEFPAEAGAIPDAAEPESDVMVPPVELPEIPATFDADLPGGDDLAADALLAGILPPDVSLPPEGAMPAEEIGEGAWPWDDVLAAGPGEPVDLADAGEFEDLPDASADVDAPTDVGVAVDSDAPVDSEPQDDDIPEFERIAPPPMAVDEAAIAAELAAVDVSEAGVPAFLAASADLEDEVDVSLDSETPAEQAPPSLPSDDQPSAVDAPPPPAEVPEAAPRVGPHFRTDICPRCGQSEFSKGSVISYGRDFRAVYFKPARLSWRRLGWMLRPFRQLVEVEAQVCRHCGLVSLQIDPEGLQQIEKRFGG